MGVLGFAVGFGNEHATLGDLRRASTSYNATANIGPWGGFMSAIIPDGSKGSFGSVAVSVGTHRGMGATLGVSRTYGLSFAEGDGFLSIDYDDWFNLDPIFDGFNASNYPSTNGVSNQFSLFMMPSVGQ